jgi:hypothetical protein
MRRYALCFLSVCVLVCPSVSHAQDAPGTLSVGPAFQEVVLGEGDLERAFSMKVSNTTGSVVALRLSVVDFGTLDESGGVAFLGAQDGFTDAYGLASWMRLESDALALGPGESQAVRVTVENRESLSPGGHYGAVVFHTEKTGDEPASRAGATVAMDQAFSSLVFVRKTGGETYGLELKEAEASPGLFRLPAKVRLRFRNQGNVHAVPRGLVTVTDPSGRIVRRGEINPESSVILPETFRSYAVALRPVEAAFLPGTYELKVRYRHDGGEEETVHVSSLNKMRYIVDTFPPAWKDERS